MTPGSDESRRELDPVIARRRAAAVAGHTGDAATARAFLTDDDAEVRAIAVAALHRLGALQRDELESALADGSPIVLRRACELATTWNGSVGDPPDERIAECIAALLDHDDDSVVETAAWACGERAPATPNVVTRLAELATTHEDSLCREAAVAALGALGDPAGLPAILEATTDRATVRRRAVLALAPFDGPEVDDALARATEDRDWQVRQAAEDLLDPGPDT